MDKIDYLILSELLVNAQLSFLQIAQKLNVSSLTVKSRYNKMVKTGIIRRSTINIDLSKLGYQGKVYLLITNSPKYSKKATIDFLKKNQNILIVSEMIGPFDVFAVAPVVDFESIKKVVKQVKNIQSIQRLNVIYVTDTSFPINPTYGKILSKKTREIAEILSKPCMEMNR